MTPETMQKVIDWLWEGETGVSSKAILQAAFDLPKPPGFSPDPPYDKGDFRRCWRLISQVPEAWAGLGNLADSDPRWFPIHYDWPRLVIWTMNGEVGQLDAWFEDYREKVLS